MIAALETVSFLGLGVLGLFALGGLLAVILMIAHPKTRVVGVVFLALGLVVLLVSSLSVVAAISRAQVQARQHAAEAQFRVEQARAQMMAEEAQRMAAEGRVQIEQHADAMRQQADAMRQQAEAMRQEADQTRRRIEEATTRAMAESPHGQDLAAEEARRLAEQPMREHESPGVVVEPNYSTIQGHSMAEAYPKVMSSSVPRMWSWLRLTVVVLAFLAFGLLATSVVMLARPRTRVAGGVLLAVVLPLMLIAGVVVPVLGHFVSGRTYSDNVTALRPPMVDTSPEVVAEYPLGPEPIPLDETTSPAVDAAEPDDGAASTAAQPLAEMPAEANVADERPAWVGQPWGRVGDTYQAVITTAPYPSRQECEADLGNRLREVVRNYMSDKLGRGARISEMVDLPQAYLDEHIVKQKWPEELHISLGDWVRVHALLQFDDEVNQQLRKMCDRAEAQLEEQWAREAVMRRLCYSGAGVAAVLMLLSVLYGCLRIDTSTGGTCRGRLCVASGALVMIIAALVMLAIVAVAGVPVAGFAALSSPGMIEPGGAQGSVSVAVDLVHSKALFVMLPVFLLLVALAIFKKTRVVALVLLGLVSVVSLFTFA